MSRPMSFEIQTNTKFKLFYCIRTNSFSTMLATCFHDQKDDLKRVPRLKLNMRKILARIDAPHHRQRQRPGCSTQLAFSREKMSN
jgi:hypothetical protein